MCSSDLRCYIVLTGSMEPTIKVGDIVIVKQLDANQIKEGDVITFNSKYSNNVITHRIIKANKNNFTTKGDANNTEDLEPVGKSQIVGRVENRIPKIGIFLKFIQENLKLMLISIFFIGILGGLVVRKKKYVHNS